MIYEGIEYTTWVSSKQVDTYCLVKTFDIPKRYPFDTSDLTFTITGKNLFEEEKVEDFKHDYQELLEFPDLHNHGPWLYQGLATQVQQDTTSTRRSRLSRPRNTSQPKSYPPLYRDTYYLYSHDGKLLAEYDQENVCTKQYIYAESRLIAEYKPQTNEYFYYTTDQINSNRLITDDSGNVVYSASYSPFGKLHKIWLNTYDPSLKFSGKEREATSGDDYFGARYFSGDNYRFLSVDPVRNRTEALANPKLWNLYSYCDNNPITFHDPDGREVISVTAEVMNKDYLIGSMGYDKAMEIYDEMYLQRGVMGVVALTGLYGAANADKIKGTILKFGNMIRRFLRLKKPSEGQINCFIRQLRSDGMNSLLKSRETLIRRLNEHITKLNHTKNTGGFTSSIQREITNFKKQIKAIDQVIRMNK